VKTEPGDLHSRQPLLGRGNGATESRGAAWARQWKLQRHQQILQQLQQHQQQRQQLMQQTHTRMQYPMTGEGQQESLATAEDGTLPMMNASPEMLQHIVMMKAALIEAAIAALEGDPQTGYLEGSHLSSLLTEVLPDYVQQVKEALGGKGWLKQLFKGDSRITNIMSMGKVSLAIVSLAGFLSFRLLFPPLQEEEG